MARIALIGASEHHASGTRAVADLLAFHARDVDLPPETNQSSARLSLEEVQRVCTERLLRADVVVCVHTPEADASLWVQGELRAAEELGLPVVLVLPSETKTWASRDAVMKRVRDAEEAAQDAQDRRWREEMAASMSIGESGPMTPFMIRDAVESLPHKAAERDTVVEPRLDRAREMLGPYRQALASTRRRVASGDLSAQDAVDGALDLVRRVAGDKVAELLASRRGQVSDASLLADWEAELDED